MTRVILGLLVAAGLAGSAPVAVGCTSDADCVGFGTRCHPGTHFCDADGTCTTPPALNCDDGDPCTVDSCSETVIGGCVHTPHCVDDGAVCNGVRFCVPTPFGPVVVPLCEDPGPPDCDDGNACTVDSCVEPTGCQYVPVVCDDGKADTTDVCDVQQGCLHFPVTTTTLPGTTAPSCRTDGDCPVDACTVGPRCVAGACVAGTRRSCDDGNACTVDVCDAATGCAHVPIAGCCTTTADCPTATDPCAPETCGTDHTCAAHERTGLDGLVCACARPIPSTCRGIPASLTKRFKRACALVTQAAAAPPSERKLLAQAGSLFGRAARAAAHARNVDPSCESGLKTLLGDAHGRAESLMDEL